MKIAYPEFDLTTIYAACAAPDTNDRPNKPTTSPESGLHLSLKCAEGKYIKNIKYVEEIIRGTVSIATFIILADSVIRIINHATAAPETRNHHKIISTCEHYNVPKHAHNIMREYTGTVKITSIAIGPNIVYFNIVDLRGKRKKLCVITASKIYMHEYAEYCYVL